MVAKFLNSRVLGVLLVAVIFFFIGFVFAMNFFGVGKTKFHEVREGSYRLINPLLECSVNEEMMVGKIKNLKSNLEDIIDQKINDNVIVQASVYFRDLNNGPWIGINEKEKFSPASLLKVPLMMAYFKQAEYDPGILKQKIKYQSMEDGIVNQQIVPTNKLKEGNEYTAIELIKAMIINSDNKAKNSLFSLVNQDKLTQVYRELGLGVPGVDSTADDFMMVKDYATFFRILYNASYLTKDYSNEALELLSQADYKNGLAAGVPKNIIVAHKFGERSFANSDTTQLHDCGIVYYPNKPYLICVMTRGKKIKQLEKVIQQISQEVYKQVASGKDD